jgi:hypothetical protein
MGKAMHMPIPQPESSNLKDTISYQKSAALTGERQNELQQPYMSNKVKKLITGRLEWSLEFGCE